MLGIGGALVLALHALALFVVLAPPVVMFAATLRIEGTWSLDAWRHAAGDLSRWGTLLRTTGVVAAVAVGGAVMAGTLLAVLVFRTRGRFRGAMIALLLLGATIPLYVVGAAFFAIGGIERWRESAVVVGAIHAAAHLPFATLIIGLALRAVPGELEEAALVDGGSPVAVLARVTLPSARGGLLAAAVLVLVWVAADYGISDVLLVRTFAEETYTQFALYGRPQEAALAGLPQVLVLAPLLVIVGRYVMGATDRGAATEATSPQPFRLGGRSWVLTVIAILAAGAPAGIPSVLLTARASAVHEAVEMVASLRPELLATLGTSVPAAFACAALAVGPAWVILRRRRAGGALAAGLAVALATPAPVLAVGLILLVNRSEPAWAGALYDSPAILTVAYVARFLPVAVLVLMAVMRAVPRDCEDAARTDGCGRLGVWWRIVWPLTLPGVLLAAFVVMILCLAELPATVLLSPPGCETVAVRYFTLIHYGLYPDAALLCVISIAVVVLPWLGVLLLLRRPLVRR
jgi:iron(III) transport system permease protein